VVADLDSNVDVVVVVDEVDVQVALWNNELGKVTHTYLGLLSSSEKALYFD